MEKKKTQIAIVGGGPAGLAAANSLQQGGYEVLILEKGVIADNVAKFPTHMNFFSTPELLELAGFPLITTREKPNRREYLNYLRRFIGYMDLHVLTGYEVTGLDGEVGNFVLHGQNRYGDEFEVEAERVVLATGAFDTPNKLGVPGEDLPKVSHYYSEAHAYYGSKVLIVGGKNSAAEIALELWRTGIEVSIVHRGAKFGTVKYWVAPDIENRIKNGEIPAYMPGKVVEITPRTVRIQVKGEPPIEIENDYVLAMTGYRPDRDFLAKFGIDCDPDTARPHHDPNTLESERPGLYMIGVMLAGNVSGEIFIENSRTHGEQILEHLKQGPEARVRA